MPKHDKRVDDYITNAPEYAIPILMHIQQLIHKACPEVEESIKWGVPAFDYKGPLFMVAAFKAHCRMVTWKKAAMPAKILDIDKKKIAASIEKISNVKDLPSSKVMLAYIKEAKKLNDEGIKASPRKKPVAAKDVVVPDYFIKELKKDKKALAFFNEFSPSQKNEYILWLTEAKTETTRDKRMETALDWIAEGKTRNWKYK